MEFFEMDAISELSLLTLGINAFRFRFRLGIQR